MRGRFDAHPGRLSVVTHACRTVRPAVEPADGPNDRMSVSDGEECSVVSIVALALAGAAEVVVVGV